ncbi:MAG: 30S ribosomal protein S12 methylthiotransferase RimO [Anaerovoracaceae bacterium]
MNIYIETLGCPKNFNDSEVCAGILKAAGNKVCDNIDHANVIIINTCGFINDAKKESIAKIFELAEYEDKILVVSGCLSKRYATELFEEMPEVDVFIGVNEYDELPNILDNFDGTRILSVKEFQIELESSQRAVLENNYTRTIKISEGCDNKCAYCIIPSIRGPYRSRPIENIIKEASKMAEEGTKELILIAQDVTTYGIDIYNEYALPRLLKELCKIEDLSWIRLMYCYEDRITDELIEVMATEPKICNYIDIPIQHSSDYVLKEMKRRSTRKSINNTIDRLRKAIPDIHIRTTLIVGFPGEREEDFDDLYDFVEKTKFERLGVFAYSKEEGTVAGDREDQIDDKIKEERKDAIMRKQIDISLAANKKMIGEIVAVLVENKEDDQTYIGRTMYDAPEIDNSVVFTSSKDLAAGQFVNVKITDAFDYDLVGVEE